MWSHKGIDYVWINEHFFAFSECEYDDRRSSLVGEAKKIKPNHSRFSLEKKAIYLYARLVNSESSSHQFDGLLLFSSEQEERVIAEFGTLMYDKYHPCYRANIDAMALTEFLKGKKN